jgi:hypothetical protein
MCQCFGLNYSLSDYLKKFSCECPFNLTLAGCKVNIKKVFKKKLVSAYKFHLNLLCDPSIQLQNIYSRCVYSRATYTLQNVYSRSVYSQNVYSRSVCAVTKRIPILKNVYSQNCILYITLFFLSFLVASMDRICSQSRIIMRLWLRLLILMYSSIQS